jgi:hypothetical protein
MKPRECGRSLTKHFVTRTRCTRRTSAITVSSPNGCAPPREPDLSGVEKAILTTYAGTLFRALLDHFGADVALAVGAYNGGPGRPNPQYEGGVRLVADYARRAMEQAAALRGERLIEVHFKVSDDAPDEK